MEFKASLASEHFKVLSSTLDAFSHLGEIVSIEIHNEQFLLCTFNSSRTAQAVAHISRDQFSNYMLLRNGSPDRILRCTVSNKNFNSIFKKNLGATRLIKECQIHITQGNSTSDQHTESRIYMKLIYENRVTKKNTLWYYDGDPISIYYERQYANHLICHPLLLKGYLTKFDPRITDLAFICTPNRLILQSHWDTTISSTGELPVRATFSINASDFDSYLIEKPIKLICNLREFRAVVDYMEAIDAKVNLNFEDMGMPILNKLFIQDKLLVNIALQTLPRHLYENQNTQEDSSFISINTNGMANMDISQSSSGTHNQQQQHQQQNSHNQSNRRQTNTNSRSTNSSQSDRRQTENRNMPSNQSSPGPSRQQTNRSSHNQAHTSSPSSTRQHEQRQTSPMHSSPMQSSPIPSSPAHSSQNSNNSTNIAITQTDMHDTIPYISPIAPRQAAHSIIPETSSDNDEEPLFTRQNRPRPLHLYSSSEADDQGQSSAERSKSQRLTTLEKLRMKKQQQRSQQNQ